MAFNPDSIDDLRHSSEKQIMDRKAAKIAPRDLSTAVVAMANADGGYLAIGIEDDGTITGIDDFEKNLNELLRVPLDFCAPSVEVENAMIDVIDHKGKANHILRMRVLPSAQVVANQADEVFLRVGDKNKKLNFEQRLQLVYARGVKYFEDEPAVGATIDDLDLEFVEKYIKKIGYSKGDAEYFLRHNNEFVVKVDDKDRISGAAILLFGVNPQKFFPRARARFVRYEGKTAGLGAQMNVIKDVKFSGRILDQAIDVINFVRTQIREYTKLGKGAVFQTIPEYPEFCWTELIVNALAHRDYSIKGTDIQIKMYDDHFVVESPGILPGIVRIDNIREFHFSRNPKIVELLTEYDLVKEFGEGVDRVFREMEEAGLPEPIYRQSGFMLFATLKNKASNMEDASCALATPSREHDAIHDSEHDSEHDGAQDAARSRTTDATQERLVAFCNVERTRQEILDYLGLASRRYLLEKYLKPLLQSGRLQMTLPDKPQSKYQKYVSVKTLDAR